MTVENFCRQCNNIYCICKNKSSTKTINISESSNELISKVLDRGRKLMAMFRSTSFNEQSIKPTVDRKPKLKRTPSNFDKLRSAMHGTFVKKPRSQSFKDKRNVAENEDEFTFYKPKELIGWTEPLKLGGSNRETNYNNSILHDIVYDEKIVATRKRLDTFDLKRRAATEDVIKGVLKRQNRMRKMQSVDIHNESKNQFAYRRTHSYQEFDNIDSIYEILLNNNDERTRRLTIDRKKWEVYVNNRVFDVEKKERRLLRSVSHDEELREIQKKLEDFKNSKYFHTFSRKKKIKFLSVVSVIQAEDWDRKVVRSWAILSGEEKAQIRQELNLFKSFEMQVHQDSRKFTRFH